MGRVRALFERHGVEEVERLGEALLDHSEQRMRAEIAAFPTGATPSKTHREDGVIPDHPYIIRLEVLIDGDEAIFDFRASDDQAAGPCNCTFGVTASAVYNAMLHLTERRHSANSGCYRPIRLLTRPGSVVNVMHPAPEVGGNSEISPRIVDLVFAAMASAAPERAPASSAERDATSSSAVSTRRPASTTPTTTWRAAAGVAARRPTATTRRA